MDPAEAADSICSPEKLEAVERGDETLTMRQAEKLAARYGRDLAFLFRSRPPDDEPAQAQLFRRLPGAPVPPWPSAMQKLAREVAQRQEAIVELRDSLGDPPAWRKTLLRLTVDPPLLPKVLREELGVTAVAQTGWSDAAGYRPLSAWREAVEALGVMVMQNGEMPVAMMRGFAALHDVAPIVVLNSKDDPRARAFTLIHELGHLWLEHYGVPVTDAEEWCERLAGEVLMPAHWLARGAAQARHARGTVEFVDEVALLFGVTPMAAAVRLRRTEEIAEDDYRAVMGELALRPKRDADGGNYYLNKITWLGPSYIRLVLDAVDEQALTLSNAAGLLGARVNHFHRLRELADARTAVA